MKVLWVLVLILGLNVFINAQTAILSGTVYDALGAVIVGAKVVAVNEKLQEVEAITNDSGVYKLKLPFKQYKTENSGIFVIEKYVLMVEAKGFEKFVLKGLNFVSSSKGEMNLDFALNVFANINTIEVDSSKNRTKRKNNKHK